MTVRTQTRRCTCGLIVTCPADAFTCPHCDRPCLDTAKGCKPCAVLNIKNDPA